MELRPSKIGMILPVACSFYMAISLIVTPNIKESLVSKNDNGSGKNN
jgi:hypothetical protein